MTARGRPPVGPKAMTAAQRQRRHRQFRDIGKITQDIRDMPPPVARTQPPVPAKALHGTNPDGSTPGALQGDDYPLEYYEDGFPKLPDH